MIVKKLKLTLEWIKPQILYSEQKYYLLLNNIKLI